MEEINQEVPHTEKSARIRATIVALTIDAHRTTMKEKNALVSKVRKLREKEQQLLSIITKL